MVRLSPSSLSAANSRPEVPPHLRQDLFVQKIRQCMVCFDFSDAASELREKEIKRQTLQEILEYVNMNRGVLTENVYPEIVNMVSNARLPRARARHRLVLIRLLSSPSTSSAPSRRKSTRLATPLIPKKTSPSWSSPGPISKSSTSSFYASWNPRNSTSITPRSTLTTNSFFW